MADLMPLEVVNQRLHDDVKRYGKIETFKAKEPIYSPEEMTKKFFFVLEGRIKVYQINLIDAKEQTLYMLGSGDMYDVVTLLDGKIHENIVEAVDDVKIVTFPIEIVRVWMKNDEQFNSLIFPYIAKQYRAIEELALDLSFLDTSKRLLKLISKSLLHKSIDGENIINNLSHEEIASMIGTVRKVLNRHIQKLKKDGLIDVSRRQIEIKDREKILSLLPQY
jgi:CRP-like cAMP-binding protein